MSFTNLKAQEWNNSICSRASRVISIIDLVHFAPKEFNDTLSSEIFDLFVDGIDPESSFFTDEDIKSLNKLGSNVYTEIADSSACTFIESSNLIYTNRLQAFAKIIQEFSTQKLDFGKKAYFKDHISSNWMTESSWGDYWQSYFKMRTLFAVYAHIDSLAREETPSLELIQDEQKKVAEAILCRIQDRIEHQENRIAYLEETFLIAVTKVFGPHNSYLSPKKEQEFYTSLSEEARSFGFDFYRNDVGQLEISSINPGSSAWNSNALNEGDLIMSIIVEEEEISDFSCLSLDYLRSKMVNIDHLDLKVRKKSGKEISVFLVSNLVAVKENRIQSFILDGPQKIGYIYLPSFYAGSNESDMVAGCATDIARNLIRLKREGIDGLIIDLRNNGGGLMQEAIRMAGLFVNYGALGVYWDGTNAPQTMKDPDKGMVYADPLVVMINTFSASASELFAAALQDHNRAIIVGSPSFGKATAQQIIPISFDPTINEEIKADASLKLTIAAFYRATSQSHQQTGVIPDVLLPDYEQDLGYRESNLPYSLANGSVDKKTYYKVLSEFPISELAAKSEARLAGDSSWQAVNSLRVLLKYWIEERIIPLAYEEFRIYLLDNELNEAFGKISRETELFKLSRPSYFQEFSDFGLDKEVEKIFQTENISEDIYIQESYSILIDFLNLKSK